MGGLARRAQSLVRSTARRTTSGGLSAGGHTSSTIWMSAPNWKQYVNAPARPTAGRCSPLRRPVMSERGPGSRVGWRDWSRPAEDRLADSALEIAGNGGVPGPVVVVSDLLSREWESALGALGAAGGGLVLQVLAPEELDPDLAGDLHLVDAETGATIDISTSTETMQRYRDGLDTFLAGVAGLVPAATGLDHILVPATPDAVTRTLDALAAQQVVR